MNLNASKRHTMAVLAWTFCLLLAVFALPYHIPVRPTISLSYQVGFSNQAAVAAFVLVGFAFAFYCRGNLGQANGENRALSRVYLWVCGAALVGLALTVLVHRGRVALGNEAHYFGDRQRLLDMGAHLYTGFEFAYGPLLIYPGHVLHAVGHLPTLLSYRIAWLLAWVVGVSMLYACVAMVDIPSKRRGAIYLLLCVAYAPAITSEGQNYTPARSYCAAFLALIVHFIWRKTSSAFVVVLASTIAIAVGFGVSAEQGLGLACGLPAYFLLLALRGKSFPARAAAALMCLSALVVAAVAHYGLLATVRFFSQGGYNFPLLPSPTNVVVLSVYLCAIFLLVRAILSHNLQGNAVALALCGLPMLSAAMGRCDTGHLMSAAPLLIVGLFIVHEHTGMRRVLVPALWVIILLPSLSLVQKVSAHVYPEKTPAASVAAQDSQSIAIDRTYYSPFTSSMPGVAARFTSLNIDQGYFLGMQDVTTPQQIGIKLEEFHAHVGMPWILPDSPDAAVPLLWDSDVAALRGPEQSPWVPKVRRPALSTAPLTDFIVQHCHPTPDRQEGVRVWECAS